MQPHSLVGCRYAKQRAHLRRVKSSLVAQQDDLPLLAWQSVDGGLTVLKRFVSEPLRLGNVVPTVRAVAPHPVGTETRSIDSGPVAVRIVPAKERGERQDARFFAPPRASDVDQDSKEPRLERRATLKPVYAAQPGQPRLLDHVFGDAAIAHVCHGELEH